MIDTAGGSVCAASYGVARTCSLEPALIPQSREKGPRLFLRGRTAGSKNHLPQMKLVVGADSTKRSLRQPDIHQVSWAEGPW